ncbi:MAG: TonB-dependent receptor plug domain-containing protein [Flavobacteriaceae bacterium]|nr:TonB-dependent receptor plug domain-containing protein [Flavobacteriaceae bacterium]
MKTRILIAMFVVVCVTNNLTAQSNTKKVTVSGFITDTNNNPIQDAVIMVDNVKLDTYVNSKGFYKIKIPSNTKNIMVFSVKNGLKEHEFKGESTVNFMLNADINTAKFENISNDDQVDVGYGTVKKSNLTSSVGTIEEDKNSSYRNIYDMIAGKVPGVTVTGNRIVIRGLSSINSGTDPLFVVDGLVTSNISDIPPSQVDNISILKGSNAAMYGARGANGVILINLKKAKRGN